MILEVAVRNAIDEQLKPWNRAQSLNAHNPDARRFILGNAPLFHTRRPAGPAELWNVAKHPPKPGCSRRASQHTSAVQ